MFKWFEGWVRPYYSMGQIAPIEVEHNMVSWGGPELIDHWEPHACCIYLPLEE